jgi:hypothetical protein
VRRPRVADLLRAKCALAPSLVPVHGKHEVEDEIRRVWCAEPGDPIPAGRCGIAGYGRVGLVIANCDVEEVVGVADGIGADLVQSGIDRAKPAAVQLVGDRRLPACGPMLSTSTRQSAPCHTDLGCPPWMSALAALHDC